MTSPTHLLAVGAGGPGREGWGRPGPTSWVSLFSPVCANIASCLVLGKKDPKLYGGSVRRKCRDGLAMSALSRGRVSSSMSARFLSKTALLVITSKPKAQQATAARSSQSWLGTDSCGACVRVCQRERQRRRETDSYLFTNAVPHSNAHNLTCFRKTPGPEFPSSGEPH